MPIGVWRYIDVQAMLHASPRLLGSLTDESTSLAALPADLYISVLRSTSAEPRQAGATEGSRDSACFKIFWLMMVVHGAETDTCRSESWKFDSDIFEFSSFPKGSSSHSHGGKSILASVRTY